MLRHLSNAAYMLKHRYPTPIVLLTIDSVGLDATTGEQTVVKTWKYVAKAVVLTAEMKQKFIYDLAYVAASKNFTEGGWFNEDTHHVLVEQKDLGNGYTISNQMFCLIHNTLYRIEATQRLREGPFSGCTMFVATGVEQTFSLPAESTFALTFGIVPTLN